MAVWNQCSDTCIYRILVADSNNHRLQVFDALGGFVSTFGNFGDGDGQFDNLQGLAIDSNGQVIVADKNNHRLQVLEFDGTNFEYIKSITANFNRPTGIATYGTDIVVADTGNNKIKVLNSNGRLFGEYDAANDGHNGTFNQPRGVIIDDQERIVVADTGNRRIVTILDAFTIQAAFEAAPASGVSPLTVVFTNTSTGDYTSSLWHFGDSLTSTLTNPTHTYALPGVYTVTLTVNGLLGETSTLTQTNYITAYTSLAPAFDAAPTSGVLPLTVVFTNTSTGDYTSSLWHFGDSLTSTLTNSTHTYALPGVYTVTLTVNGLLGETSTLTQTNYITVTRGIYMPIILKQLDIHGR